MILERVIKSSFLILALLTSLVSFLILFSTSYQSPWVPSYYYFLLIVVSLVVCQRKPILIFSTFLFLLPFWGNRPESDQAFVGIFLTSLVIVSLSFYFVMRSRDSLRFENNGLVRQSVFVIMLFYTIASFLSLTGLPSGSILGELQSKLLFDSIDSFTFSFVSLLREAEHTVSYSLVSVFNTSSSFLIAYYAYLLVVEKIDRCKFFLFLMLLSLITSMFIGIADYFSIISLEPFRALDPVVNPGGVQYRLQSVFGHSGWFAEYVTLCVPLIMMCLLLRLSIVLRIFLIVSMLIFGELVLVLCYQRGGWLSYPITLFGVWIAVYIVYSVEKGKVNFLQALKSSILKILISMPLTVCLSLLILGFLQKAEVVGKDRFSSINHYVDRFKNIKKVSDRSEFIHAGFLLGTKYPFLGGGSESFAYQFEREFEDPRGSFYKRYTLPLHGSAHNVYMQTFAGKGIAGLFFLLLIPFSFFVMTYKLIKNGNSSNQDSLVFLLLGSCTSFAFLIYGNVQEIFYIQSLQLVFFIILLLASYYSVNNFSKKTHTIFFLLLVFALFGQLVWKELSVESVNNNEYGCYVKERLANGDSYSWCSSKSRFSVSHFDHDDSAKVIKLKVRGHGLASSEPYDLQFFHDDVMLLECSIRPGKIEMIELLVPESFNKLDYFSVVSDRYFIPSRKIRGSLDKRILSFQIYYNTNK